MEREKRESEGRERGEKAEREAKELAERERLEGERLERERREREARERGEKEEQDAREKAAREAKEKAERQAAEHARREADERKRHELILELAPGVRMKLVRVPAGGFLMGSDKSRDKDADDDETPQHKLDLPEFLIGKYPVTVAQVAAFVQASGYKSEAVSDTTKGDHPVTSVRWYDVVAFCQWASQKMGRQVRLLSEAEWEKAARGTDGRIYPWGNQAPDEKRCNFDGNVGGTTPVGQYSPEGDSPYGCADMAGNVWEWTGSLFKPYPYKFDDGREDSKDRGMRVLRGGSFYIRWGARCAFRFRFDPDGLFDYHYGFRVGVVPPI